MRLLSLFLPLLALVAAQDIQTETKIVSINDTNLLYFPVCQSHDPERCNGAWSYIYDPVYNGTIMRCTPPTTAFGNVQCYFSYTFAGTGFEVWMWATNKSGGLVKMFQGDDNSGGFYFQRAFGTLLTDVPKLVMVWNSTGLKPGYHTFGVQRTTTSDSDDSVLEFDHLVIQSVVGELPKDNNNGKIIGGAVAGGVIGLLLIAGLVFGYYRRKKRDAKKAERQTRIFGSNTNPSSGGGGGIIRYEDPSAEIMRSERLAKEGRVEESKQSKESIEPEELKFLSGGDDKIVP